MYVLELLIREVIPPVQASAPASFIVRTTYVLASP